MSYTVPDGDAVDLVFAGTYTTPEGDEVHLVFGLADTPGGPAGPSTTYGSFFFMLAVE